MNKKAYLLSGEPPKDLATRLFSMVDRSDLNGCWIWTGPVRKPGTPSEYGAITVSGVRHRAHRIAWWVAYGWAPLPEDNCLRICLNTRCVRPEHLCLADDLVKVRRSMKLGRFRCLPGYKGVRHRRLDASQAREVCARYVAPGSNRATDPGNANELAAEFGVSRQVILEAANHPERFTGKARAASTGGSALGAIAPHKRPPGSWCRIKGHPWSCSCRSAA